MSQTEDLRKYRNAVLAVNAAMGFIAKHDLPTQRKVLDEVDTIGPLMKPVAYRAMRDKIEFDKALLDAAMPLWRFCREQSQKEGSAIIQSSTPSIIIP